jgi:high affinity Mn2+ porin
MEFDTNLAQAHADNLELEYRYAILSRPGKARLLAYANHAHMGDYRETLASYSGTPDITTSRAYRVKYGFGLNVEQELYAHVGAFSRLGWNDGATESWAFTEVYRTISLGAAAEGELWGRPGDKAGAAAILNGISAAHAAYLTAGGLGFILGDGALRYALEKIAEVYYSFRLLKQLSLTANYQWVGNPGYNADRGPASIFAGRLHYEF